MARPFLPLLPFLGLPHRLRYLHPNPPSLFVSLSFSLTITVRSLLRLCFSFPRAALLACRFFSSPPLAFVVPYRRQSPSPVGTLPTRPSRSPYLFPHIRPAHPYKKLKSSVGATGGFSLRFLLPSSHHSSFTSLLTFSCPLPSCPFPLLPVSLFHPPVSLLRAVLYLRFIRSESVALSHFIMHLKVASPLASTSDSQPLLERR